MIVSWCDCSGRLRRTLWRDSIGCAIGVAAMDVSNLRGHVCNVTEVGKSEEKKVG